MIRTSQPPLAIPRSADSAAPAAFDFYPLTRVVFGPGTLSRLGEITRELGGRRVLVVTDAGLTAAGHPARALASLHAAGLQTFLYDGVEENPTTKDVNACLAFARQAQVDSIVAVGG